MVGWQYLIVIIHIKIAKHQGYTSLGFAGEVYPAIIKKLENKGYRVDDGITTEISWEDENVRK